ncbi:hypothetical protein XM38_036570 [Halomicronema hongdechloris C2206]|uniref:Uncharacterized protein n=1 Tax=Halomicronema hongdechloris C2206 TaxID=1641165 RepID=A0A1Z3HQU8_9CYAN|nr:DUF1822 family protein [Halomicronema hongdechloris]ASC72699.1 hypothetical protein XM38_036570 [Halomicronema hongdechloris C2206]
MFDTTSDTTLLNPETILLELEDIQRASQNSQLAPTENLQWDLYLQGLAVLGLQRSLQNRLRTRAVDIEQSTLFEPGYAGLLNGTCGLAIGPFRACLIATESIIDGVVKIPQAAVELPEFIPHFCLVVEVIEEHEELIFRGVLRCDRFQDYRQSMNLEADDDWVYRVPLTLFEQEPSRLVFYAEQLDIATLSLPERDLATSSATMAVPELQQVLADVSMTDPLWQQLTWEQAAAILTSPALRAEFHCWQQPAQSDRQSQGLQTAVAAARQSVIDVGQWLESGLDEVAQSLGFLTGSQLQFASAMKSQPLSEVFEGAIATLREDGLLIPEVIRPLYRNVELEELDLCLCLLPYRSPVALETASDAAIDWSLLVIVGSQSDRLLPAGLQLKISREMDLLEAVDLEFEEVLVYSSVDARVGEVLNVEIIAPGETAFALPPLTYDAGES